MTQLEMLEMGITSLSSTDGATTLSRINLSCYVGHATIFS